MPTSAHCHGLSRIIWDADCQPFNIHEAQQLIYIRIYNTFHPFEAIGQGLSFWKNK
jgi:hypothetical protein